jgi:D-amino-acid oxidase
VVGGTADEGVWDLAVSPEASETILAKGRALEPRLTGVADRGAKVGLRPGRREVRLEMERPSPGLRVIHNYGHGGAGITLSWGCAREVAELAREAARELQSLSSRS